MVQSKCYLYTHTQQGNMHQHTHTPLAHLQSLFSSLQLKKEQLQSRVSITGSQQRAITKKPARKERPPKR